MPRRKLTVEKRTAQTRVVGPGIAARLDLLPVNVGDDVSLDSEVEDRKWMVQDVTMVNQESMLIKRRKRKGQSGEDGVRVVRLDSSLKLTEESQVSRKRKLFKGGVTRNKKRMFGKNLPVQEDNC